MSDKCFSWEDWEDQIRGEWLTIDDIMKLEPGDELELLALDRNVWDIACSINDEGKKYTAKHFFRNNKVLYTHETDLKGTLILYYNSDDYPIDEFEFDIEWEKGEWYPLVNGMLPKEDPQGFSKFPDGMTLDWKRYPVTTHIGYRGPMVKWKRMGDLPKIYYNLD